MDQDLPFASACRGINDSLRGFDFTKASSIGSKGLVVGIGMQPADVDVTITVDWVRQTLIKGSHALTGSEDCWNGTWNRWIRNQQSINVNIDGDTQGFVWQRLCTLSSVREGERLW